MKKTEIKWDLIPKFVTHIRNVCLIFLHGGFVFYVAFPNIHIYIVMWNKFKLVFYAHDVKWVMWLDRDVITNITNHGVFTIFHVYRHMTDKYKLFVSLCLPKLTHAPGMTKEKLWIKIFKKMKSITFIRNKVHI